MKKRSFRFRELPRARRAAEKKRPFAPAALIALALCWALSYAVSDRALRDSFSARADSQVEIGRDGRPFLKPKEEEAAGISLSIESAATEIKEKAAHKKTFSGKKPSVAPKPVKSVAKPSAPPKKEPLEKAQTFERDGKWKETVSAYETALKKDKKNEKALKGLIRALARKGDEAALERLEDLAETHPKNAEIYAARARLLERQKDFLVALEARKKAVELDRGNDEYKLDLAILLDRLDRRKEAVAAYASVKAPLPRAVRERLAVLRSLEKGTPP